MIPSQTIAISYPPRSSCQPLVHLGVYSHCPTSVCWENPSGKLTPSNAVSRMSEVMIWGTMPATTTKPEGAHHPAAWTSSQTRKHSNRYDKYGVLPTKFRPIAILLAVMQHSVCQLAIYCGASHLASLSSHLSGGSCLLNLGGRCSASCTTADIQRQQRTCMCTTAKSTTYTTPFGTIMSCAQHPPLLAVHRSCCWGDVRDAVLRTCSSNTCRTCLTRQYVPASHMLKVKATVVKPEVDRGWFKDQSVAKSESGSSLTALRAAFRASSYTLVRRASST
jgi:hypothetical protein